jgi:thiosulfate/3-mercaptopyruvate sulfurtransferase
MTRALGAVLVAMSLLLGGGVKAVAAPMPLLVSADWLRARLADPDLRVVDMTSDAAEYARGHIPGALHIQVDEIRIPLGGGVYRLPTPEEGVRILGRLGIGPATKVVIYDEVGGLHASRLFFTLDVWGHRSAALLDGGTHAWRRAGHPLTREVPVIRTTAQRPGWESSRVIDGSALRDRLGRPGLAVVDARSPAEYAGREVRARRGGHIPGAVNLEWRLHLNPDGTFKPLAELRAMYVARGVTPDKTVVTYCQTNHRASHSYFVLRLLGYERVVAYDASWAEWGNRDDLPVAR